MAERRLMTIDEALGWTARDGVSYYKQYINPGLARLMGLLKIDRKFVRAENCVVWDDQGIEYLDFLGGYGALNFGHNNGEIIDSFRHLFHKKYPNILQISLNSLTAALGHNLSLITPGDLEKSFFCNSGAEAVEGALKLARKATGRTGILYGEGSFHGKTFGALSVTGRKKYQLPFYPLVPDCSSVPFGDLDALANKLKSENTACFIIEPIQGEGGMVVPPPGYLGEVNALCKKHGTLFIADEIQTGMGRTGCNFACEWEDASPDIMTLSKSLGGGVMPLGAYISTTEVWKKAYGDLSGQDALLHTSTFGGNSLACLAGLKSIEILTRDKMADQAEEKGSRLMKGLMELKERYPKKIKDVRGRGLMLGVEFQESSLPGIKSIQAEYQAALVAGRLFNKHGVITAYTLNNPNVIRLEPPLTVSSDQIDKVLAAFDSVCSRGGFLKDGLGLIRRT